MKTHAIYPITFNSNNKYKSEYAFEPIPKSEIDEDKYFKPVYETIKEKRPQQWNNIENIADKIPKTINGLEALANYTIGKINYDEFLKDCSKGNIELICNPATTKRSTKGQVEALEEIFNKGSVEASNYEMILELTQEGLLHPSTALFCCEDLDNTRLSPQFIEDLDKIYQAKIEKKNLEDIFVPKFENKQRAIENLKTGETCILKDDKFISIKLKDNSLKQLFITPETYLELFPPAQRFAVLQGEISDCYFVSIAAGIFENENTRHILLEKFKENEDNTLSVCLEGYENQNGEISPKNPEFEIKDAQKFMKNVELENKTTKCARQIEAIRILENAFREELKSKAYEQILAFRSVFEQVVPKMPKDTDCVEISELYYTKKEMELFLELTKDTQDKEKLLKTMVSIDHLNYTPVVVNPKIIEFFNNYDEKSASKEEQYAHLAIIRHLEFMANNEVENCFLTGLLPIDFYKEYYYSGGPKSGFDYLDMGTNIESYKKLGFENVNYILTDENKEEALDLLNLDDLNSKFLIAASGAKPENKLGVLPQHAYFLKQVEIDGEKKIILKNPMNTSKDVIVSAEEAADIFEQLFFAKID